jgi:hypothetical protein
MDGRGCVQSTRSDELQKSGGGEEGGAGVDLSWSSEEEGKRRSERRVGHLMTRMKSRQEEREP